MSKSGRGTIPVEPLRRAFERSGMTAGAVARELGWYRRRGEVDGCRVRRYLGLQAYPLGAGMSRHREHVDYATALKIAQVLEAAPVEIGL